MLHENSTILLNYIECAIGIRLGLRKTSCNYLRQISITFDVGTMLI